MKLSNSRYMAYEPLTGFLTFKVDKLSPEQLETLEKVREKPIEVILKSNRKRSLDSNSYMWVILSKIAEVVGSSKDEVYEECLQKYGYLDEDAVITVKAECDISRIDGHWRFLKGNGSFKAYIRIIGTSEYDPRRMNHFLDQVIIEAQELGIETDTPEQIEEYKRLYEKRYGKADSIRVENPA